jgi:predicted nucleic acid-binding protein
MEIKITSIAASYDRKDRLMIYLRGKIDMSCCYPSPITLEFYDHKNNLVQLAKTDLSGNFKVKSINGNMMEISKGRIKFNFSKVVTFDGNADTRNAEVVVYKKQIDEQFASSQNGTVTTTAR